MLATPVGLTRFSMGNTKVARVVLVRMTAANARAAVSLNNGLKFMYTVETDGQVRTASATAIAPVGGNTQMKMPEMDRA